LSGGCLVAHTINRGLSPIVLPIVPIFAGHQVNKKGKMATLERIVELRKRSGDKYYAFVEKDARKKLV
jgi:cytochrome c biogenesis protein CcdA